MITPEALEAWKADPTTMQIFEAIKKIIAAQTEVLTTGQTLPDQTWTARIIGEIEGLNHVLNISHEGDREDEGTS